MRFRPTPIELSLGAARFDADQQVAARELRRLRARTRRLHCLATIFALGFQAGAPRIERIERHQSAIELGAGARQRVLREARLARDFRGLLFQALAPHRRFLRAGALAFELTQQVGVIAMRALDAALRLVALALGLRQVFAAGGQARFAVAHIVFAARELARAAA